MHTRRWGTLAPSHQLGCDQFESEQLLFCNPESAMLHYAVVFLVIALIAALFGFGGIGAAGIAETLFVLFAVLAVGTFLFGLIRKR